MPNLGAGGKFMSDTDLTQALKVIEALSTGTLTTQLLKRGLPSTFIAGVHPLNPDAPRFVGLAYTLRLIPKREDKMSPDTVTSPLYPQRHAVEDCPPGHVLVIDARGITETGTLGDILVARLQARGVAGVVTDGAMRDTGALMDYSIPVFCGGRAARNSHVDHLATETQVPIACGGAAVFPGDVLFGDEDGVVVFPADLATELAADGARQERLETFLQRRVLDGAPIAGTYPPDAETLAAFQKWDKEN
jgi:regulator of RNase E activity RraA